MFYVGCGEGLWREYFFYCFTLFNKYHLPSVYVESRSGILLYRFYDTGKAQKPSSMQLVMAQSMDKNKYLFFPNRPIKQIRKGNKLKNATKTW